MEVVVTDCPGTNASSEGPNNIPLSATANALGIQGKNKKGEGSGWFLFFLMFVLFYFGFYCFGLDTLKTLNL